MHFMVHFRFAGPPDAERLARIPAEGARIRELHAQDIVDVLYLSADRSEGWLVMQGATPEAVEQALATLPLHPYMTTEMIPLADLGA